MTAPLSRAAQAVLDAVRKICPAPADEIAAAAIRAAVDQVVPAVLFDRRYITEERWDARDDIRSELLSIATELDPTP
jgi:hypothetical protein